MTVKKKTWKCPRCGQSEKPPKAYVCPVCKLQLTTESTPAYDHGASSSRGSNMDIEDILEKRMGYEDFDRGLEEK